jgi:SAM-dependent methyltransferase
MHPHIWHWDFLAIRPLLREVRRFSRSIEQENAQRLLDLGCGAKPYASLFSSTREYIGFDAVKNERVDVVGVNWDLPFANNSFDALLSTQVLEHTEKLAETVREIRRVVKNNGLIFISAPMTFPEHDIPHDYWRFTRFGLKALFKDFEVLAVKPQTGYLNTLLLLLNVFLCYIPASQYLLWPLFMANNLAALAFDMAARFIGNIGSAALRDGYERGYLALPESTVIILRNRKDKA